MKHLFAFTSLFLFSFFSLVGQHSGSSSDEHPDLKYYFETEGGLQWAWNQTSRYYGPLYRPGYTAGLRIAAQTCEGEPFKFVMTAGYSANRLVSFYKKRQGNYVYYSGYKGFYDYIHFTMGVRLAEFVFLAGLYFRVFDRIMAFTRIYQDNTLIFDNTHTALYPWLKLEKWKGILLEIDYSLSRRWTLAFRLTGPALNVNIFYTFNR